MRPRVIELVSLHRTLADVLASYTDETMRFGDAPALSWTPQQNYSAQAEIPVMSGTARLGTLTAILFAPGDGTGNATTYTVDEVVIPERYRHDTRAERVIPHATRELLCEVCFPLVSVDGAGRHAPLASHLEVLGFAADGRTIGLIGRVGQADTLYQRALASKHTSKPRGYLTVDNLRRNQLDSRAVYAPDWLEAWQLVGFLRITDKDSPLLKGYGGWLPLRR